MMKLNICFRTSVTVFVLLAAATVVRASDWAGADANWSSIGNPGWNGPDFPNAAGATALHPESTTSTTTVDLGSVIVGTLSLTNNSNNSWTIKAPSAGTANITLNQNSILGDVFVAKISNTNTTADILTPLILSSGATATTGLLTLTLADDLLISNTSASTAVNGAIQIQSPISGTGNVTFNSTAPIGSPTNGSFAGAIRLENQNTGNSTFAGSVLIQKGLVTYSGVSFGATANVITLGASGQGDAAMLATSSSGVVANNITVASGSGGTLTLGSASNNPYTPYTGNITLNGNLSLRAGTTSTTSVQSYTGNIGGVGALTKTGTAIAALIGTNTYGGGTTVSAGTLELGNGGSTGSITGNVSVAAATSFSFNRGDAYAFGGAITGAGSVIKKGAGTVTLSGTNNYSGTTTISDGILQFANPTSLYNNVSANWTAAKLIVTTTAAFNVGGTGEFLASDIDILKGLGTGSGGFKANSAIGFDTTNASGGTFSYASDIANTNGGSNLIGITKLGTNTLSLSGTNTYTGKTVIFNGTLVKAGANSVGAGRLIFGSTSTAPTTVGTLDLGSFDQTVASLAVQTNSATANTILIGSGKTLTVGGDPNNANVFSVGDFDSTTAAFSTRLNVSGSGGKLAVTDPTRNIVVAQTRTLTGIPGLSPTTLDLSALGTFETSVANIYVGRSTTSIGGATGFDASPQDTLLLANSNNVTVASNILLGVVNGSSAGSPFGAIKLGTSNSINAATWVVGASRGNGTVEFNTGLTNPSVTLRGAGGGATRTNIILGDGNNGSGLTAKGGSSTSTGTMDFSAGTVDALIGTLTIGNGGSASSGGGRGQGNGVFTFNAGTGPGSIVDVDTLLVGNDTSDNTASTTAISSTGTLNVNGGALVVNTALTIANDRDNSGSGGGVQNVAGTFNLNGGTATIGTVGTPVNTLFGNHSSTGTGTTIAALNLLGGTYTSNGDILRGAIGSGNITSILTLDGGTLNMTGHNLADSNPGWNLNFKSGTLSNVLQINGGTSGLVKTTSGVLTLAGTNNYTSSTSVQGGTLLVNGTHTAGGAYTVDSAAKLGGTGTINAQVQVNSGGILAPGAGIGTLTVDGNSIAAPALTLATGATLDYELNNSFASDQLALVNGEAGDISFNGNVIDFTDLASGNLATGDYTLFSSDVAGFYSGLTVDGGNVIQNGLTIDPGFLGVYSGSVLKVTADDKNIILSLVAPTGLAGDYNSDGKVDAADYVVWRKNPTVVGGGDPIGYNTWRTNFGNPSGSGSGGGNSLTGTGTSVPEPSTIALVAFGLALLIGRETLDVANMHMQDGEHAIIFRPRR